MPDQRGYNHSSKPQGVQNYNISFLAADISGLIAKVRSQFPLPGHDREKNESRTRCNVQREETGSGQWVDGSGKATWRGKGANKRNKPKGKRGEAKKRGEEAKRSNKLPPPRSHHLEYLPLPTPII